MSYSSDLSIDTRTCGQADEDAYLDRRDGMHTRAIAAWVATHANQTPRSQLTVAAPACPFCGQARHAKMCQQQRLADLLSLHAAAWWRDIEASDYVERVNATYAAYVAAGGTDAHYDAHWRSMSDAAKEGK